MNFLRTITTAAWPIIFLLLLGFVFASCDNGTVIPDPKVVKPPPPVPSGSEVSVRIEVISRQPVFYQWRTDPGGGEIIRGKTSAAAVWQAPQEGGTYNIHVGVEIDGKITYKSITIEVNKATSTPTPVPPTTTSKPTPVPPTTTPTPTDIPSHTLTPTPTSMLTPTPTSLPLEITTVALTPLPPSVTEVNAILVDQPPTVDGRLDEPIWSQAQPLTYAVHPPANDSTTMTVRLLWDDKYLYAGFDVSDTQVEDSSLDNVWDGDSVGVIIDNGGQVREYRYTMLGDVKERSRLVGDRAGTNTSEANFKGKTTLNNPDDQDEGYTVEMRIPWEIPPTAGSMIDADLWSIDHDYNPGKRYDHLDTIHFGISWDGDRNVTTPRKSILLATTSPPLPANTSTPAPTESNSGLVIDLGIHIFTSGSAPGQEMGRQEIPIDPLEPGEYTLTLQNASPGYSGHWLIWDYLALRSAENIIWAIGNSDAPPDYSEHAFAEFCHPQQRGDCTAEFTVGTTSVGDFVQELNDGSFPIEKIQFEIMDQQTNMDLTLVLSTLYSIHEGAENFPMQISLTRE